ncbi:hypothetical protein [Mangrovibrevibacter kandeliae]|uniref:hypothetical protein n=1 Tax=Mangrovibrevibacter kandeliae TaxID=2968473 RepID=UPI0021199FA5|nr:hypothetical protein [Aurantimonas sp. CSK15Z-1]MCQ8784030.1 hypothetical protein [Aurantimonas sp. CSK15Z-1]
MKREPREGRGARTDGIERRAAAVGVERRAVGGTSSGGGTTAEDDRRLGDTATIAVYVDAVSSLIRAVVVHRVLHVPVLAVQRTALRAPTELRRERAAFARGQMSTRAPGVDQSGGRPDRRRCDDPPDSATLIVKSIVYRQILRHLA